MGQTCGAAVPYMPGLRGKGDSGSKGSHFKGTDKKHHLEVALDCTGLERARKLAGDCDVPDGARIRPVQYGGDTT